MKLSTHEALKTLARRQGKIARLEQQAEKHGYAIYHHRANPTKPHKVIVELFGPGAHTIKAGGKSLAQALSRAVEEMKQFIGV